MKFIETVEEWNQVIDTIKQKDIYLTYVLSDVKAHPAMNTVCVLSFQTPEDKFLVSFNHNDCISLNVDIVADLSVCNVVWVYDKKSAMHALSLNNLRDTASLDYLYNRRVVERDVSAHVIYHRMYDSHINVNRAVPIMTLIEMLNSELDMIHDLVHRYNSSIEKPEFKFLSDIAIPTLQFIESSGLHIDPQLMFDRYGNRIKRYIDKERDLIFSEYNLYTTTGRCSCKFGGISFVSLNKKDGSRAPYTSRYDDGVMIMIDFESFHLRLIADIIGYEFPSDEPIHEYLAKQYFNTDVVTPEQYEESKIMTFRLMYGDTRNRNVPEFFVKIYEYIDMLMVLLDRNGYVTSPYFFRKIYKDDIEDVTPAKVFNYIIQLAETERNLSVMKQFIEMFRDTKSKPVLYTYDSVLFDYSKSDGRELLTQIVEVMTSNNKFPVRVYYGNNYADIKRLS